jgi:TetR/AcrR family transcriptional regulator, transcriptional repressor for nem operon
MTSTREHILDAAGRLIHLRGFHNTSVDDILRESGVGKGNLYYYFKSKDELGYAALDRTLERIREDVLERVFATDLDPWAQLEMFLEFPMERVRRDGCTGGCPLGNLAMEMSDVHEGFRTRLSLAFGQLQSQLEATLERARLEDTLRPGTDIPRLAHFILAGLEGAFMMGKLHRNADLMANVLDDLKAHVTLHRVAPHTEDRHTS